MQAAMLKTTNTDRNTQHQKSIAQHGTNNRGTHNISESFSQGDDTNNQLGRITKRREKQTTNAFTGTFRYLLNSFANQTCQRYNAQASNDKEQPGRNRKKM